MRILVLSDSHGKSFAIRKILDKHPEAKHIFFLGDGLRDIEYLEKDYPNLVFHKVCGNCDVGCSEPYSNLERVEDKLIFFTHGHNFYVKSGIGPLVETARKRGADIMLFGHTHMALTSYEDGLYIVNPGSVAMGRSAGNSYAIIDIEKNGTIPIIVKAP